MKPKMTQEHKESVRLGKLKAKAMFDQQKFQIDEKWSIERDDLYNWVIRVKGVSKPYGFYGKLADALSGVPIRMLNEAARSPLIALRDQIADLKAVVENAVKDARLKAALTDEQKTMLTP